MLGNILLGLIIFLFLIFIICMICLNKKYQFKDKKGRIWNVEYDMGYPYRIEEQQQIYYTDNNGPIFMPKKYYYGRGGPYQDFKLTVDYECPEDDKKNKSTSDNAISPNIQETLNDESNIYNNLADLSSDQTNLNIDAYNALQPDRGRSLLGTMYNL